MTSESPRSIKRAHGEVTKGDSPENQPNQKKTFENTTVSDNSPYQKSALSLLANVNRPTQADDNTKSAMGDEATTRSTDQKLDIVLEKLNKIAIENININSQLGEINSKLNGLDILENSVAKISGELEIVQSRLQTKDIEVNKLREEVNELKLIKQRVISLEAHSRRDNLIFHGLRRKGVGQEESDAKCREAVFDFLVCQLKITDARERIKIVRAHRKPGPLLNGARPMIVKFHYYPDRQEVWAKRFGLKGKGGLWMSEDFPIEIENERDILKPYFNRALKLNLKPKMNYNKLIVNGNTYTIKNIGMIPETITIEAPDMAGCQSECIVLHEFLNPLLSTHPSPIEYQGASYYCLEQFYQYQKAEICQDMPAAKKILETRNTRLLKKIGGRIEETPAWANSKDDVMYRGLEIKLKKNEQLCSYLKSTGTKTLVVANTGEQYWGIGLNAKDERCLNPTEWPGSNHYGQLLMCHRDKLVEQEK